MMTSMRIHRTSTELLVEMGTQAVPFIESYVLRAWLLVLDQTLCGGEGSQRELRVVLKWGGDYRKGPIRCLLVITHWSTWLDNIVLDENVSEIYTMPLKNKNNHCHNT